MTAKESTMTSQRSFGVTLTAVAVAAVAALHAAPSRGSERNVPVPPTAAESEWATRTVYACDHRKAVVVEGVRPDEKLPPQKAQRVADLLMDLMRFCNEEVTARISTQDLIVLSVNGLPYVKYVPGGELPIELVKGKSDYGDRDRAIWKAEVDKLVKEGDRLFHSDEIGTNGLACAMCHPNAANTHPETYPKFQVEMKKVALLRDMVNWCIENPLEGKPLPDDDPRMKALEAYILSQRVGVKMEPGKH
jgi:thiosulfate dehydrogenase